VFSSAAAAASTAAASSLRRPCSSAVAAAALTTQSQPPGGGGGEELEAVPLRRRRVRLRSSTEEDHPRVLASSLNYSRTSSRARLAAPWSSRASKATAPVSNSIAIGGGIEEGGED
jgi:hypothetical protein